MIWYERGSLIGVLCYISYWPEGRFYDLVTHMHLTLLNLCVMCRICGLNVISWGGLHSFLNWQSTELELHDRLRSKCECYTYLLLYVQDKWQYQLSITCYVYYEMHWFCFWVGNYPLSVWLLKPSIIPFFPRFKGVEDHRACCYSVLSMWSYAMPLHVHDDM